LRPWRLCGLKICSFECQSFSSSQGEQYAHAEFGGEEIQLLQMPLASKTGSKKFLAKKVLTTLNPRLFFASPAKVGAAWRRRGWETTPGKMPGEQSSRQPTGFHEE
jgi:hypothetical protein